jgi:hypothetical protein
MDLTLREHLRRLDERLQLLNREIMENSSLEERNKIEAEIRAANLAISHYKAALEQENRLASTGNDS